MATGWILILGALFGIFIGICLGVNIKLGKKNGQTLKSTNPVIPDEQCSLMIPMDEQDLDCLMDEIRLRKEGLKLLERMDKHRIKWGNKRSRVSITNGWDIR